MPTTGTNAGIGALYLRSTEELFATGGMLTIENLKISLFFFFEARTEMLREGGQDCT